MCALAAVVCTYVSLLLDDVQVLVRHSYTRQADAVLPLLVGMYAKRKTLRGFNSANSLLECEQLSSKTW